MHGIVTQAGGTVSLDTEEGAGTVFHVYLPAACARLLEKVPAVLDRHPNGYG